LKWCRDGLNLNIFSDDGKIYYEKQLEWTNNQIVILFTENCNLDQVNPLDSQNKLVQLEQLKDYYLPNEKILRFLKNKLEFMDQQRRTLFGINFGPSIDTISQDEKIRNFLHNTLEWSDENISVVLDIENIFNHFEYLYENEIEHIQKYYFIRKRINEDIRRKQYLRNIGIKKEVLQELRFSPPNNALKCGGIEFQQGQSECLSYSMKE